VAGAAEAYGGKALSVGRDQLDLTPVPATPFGDFDRDGFNDVLAVDTATGQLFRYPGRGTSLGPRLLMGSGWGSFQPLL